MKPIVLKCHDCGTVGSLNRAEMYVCDDMFPRCPKCSEIVVIKISDANKDSSMEDLIHMIRDYRDQPTVISVWVQNAELCITQAVKKGKVDGQRSKESSEELGSPAQ